jgi:hypothetical protein
MRAQFLVDTLVLALAEQVEIEIGDLHVAQDGFCFKSPA